MKNRTLILCALIAVALMPSALAQTTSGQPDWARESFFQDGRNSYLKTFVITDISEDAAYQKLSQMVEEERRSTIGKRSRGADEGEEAGFGYAYHLVAGPYKVYASNNAYCTYYYLVQICKTYNCNGKETVHVGSTQYGFSPRVLVPGMMQAYKGQTGKATLFITAEVACVGGIVASQSLKASNISLMNSTHNNALKQRYSQRANMWNMAGYGFIAGTAAFYAWSLIDGLVSPGKPRTFLADQFQMAPIASPEFSGLALTLNF